ncbi:MAG: M10 family metallopeptidase [Novosphingobium sp.]|nr:M10 family metallopeptidase [Novosphingobium sp.]
MTRVAYSPSIISEWLDSGYRLVAGQFTWSIPGATSLWSGYGADDEPGLPGFATPSAALAAGFEIALGTWDELIAPDLVQVADDQTTRGEIRLAITDIQDDLAAYAYFPTGSDGRDGDVWLNALDLPQEWDQGSYGFVTLIHEIGHVFGLDHPFVVANVPESFDSQRYTVMSYNWIEERIISFSIENGEFFANFAQPVAETPMVLDIATIQQLYGADLQTRADSTTYTFEAMSPTLQTIYDASGTDTFDLSGISFANTVDLQPGAYSSIGKASVAEQIEYWSAKFPYFRDFITEVFTKYMPEQGLETYTFTDNVAIALSTFIENVLGGSGNDEISGNSANNVLIGNNGDDQLVGLNGHDRLEGGDGNDKLFGDGILVMPSDLASEPTDPAAPAPVDPTPVDPVPVDPVPVETDPSDGDSGGGFRLKIGTTAASLILPEKFELAYAEKAGAERASLRLTIATPDPNTPTTDTDTDTNPDSVPADPIAPVKDDLFDDTLLGGNGNDLLVGGAGRDWLSGGRGADTFQFAGGDFAGASVDLADVISDFNADEGDILDLSAIDALAGGKDDAFRFLGSAEFSGLGAELRTTIVNGYFLLQGDTTGDGIADFAIRLDGLTSLSVGAIII